MDGAIDGVGQESVFPYYNYVNPPKEETRQVVAEERQDARVEIETKPQEGAAAQSQNIAQAETRQAQRVETSDEGSKPNDEEKKRSKAMYVDKYI